ncbi:MAG: UDP-N-acetylmuramate dehydrogenase [Bacilli bacterium]|nr:UDP-N-acetylmuramate dehydrogenase [Bacilli bacterium]
MENIINEIMNKNIGDIKVSPSLSHYTTYKVGGTARLVVYPKNASCLVTLMEIINKYDVKYFILGNGSNVLFSDDLYDGIIIKLDKFDEIDFQDNIVRVGAGYSLIRLSLECAKRGLAGLEFASGIPGTVGGAVFMNAGAYNSDMKSVVKDVTVLTPDLKIITLANSEMKFNYRESFLQHHKGYICLGATLKLGFGERSALEEIIKERKLARKRTQPLEYPSAGSVFRNPKGLYAGKLIEDMNMKGYQVGGAMISTKHANFIINVGSATASDIKEIIDYVKKQAKITYNINLRVEQRLINWGDFDEKEKE